MLVGWKHVSSENWTRYNPPTVKTVLQQRWVFRGVLKGLPDFGKWFLFCQSALRTISVDLGILLLIKNIPSPEIIFIFLRIFIYFHWSMLFCLVYFYKLTEKRGNFPHYCCSHRADDICVCAGRTLFPSAPESSWMWCCALLLALGALHRGQRGESVSQCLHIALSPASRAAHLQSVSSRLQSV